jgi:uncharacterized linocin/CFP29 family protein
VPNALGKMVVGYEKVTDMDVASTSLDGLGQTNNDVQEFDLSQMPLPITHKDFFINLRKLAASRESGEALDTTNIRVAGRRVVEQLEKMLFQGGPTFGTLKIYGYTTHPDRNHAAFDGGKDWGDATKTGTSYLDRRADDEAGLIDDRFYGPFTIYVSSDADTQLDRDYDTSANRISIRARLLQVAGLTAIRVADQLPTANVVMKQDSSDVAVWVNGENLQTIQWDEAGGLKVHFKAMAIGVPLVKSTSAGRSGVVPHVRRRVIPVNREAVY